MKLAELFIDLGVPNAKSAVKDLNTAKGTLGEMKTSALALKAAVVGAFYGMQQFGAKSNQTGTDLKNLSTLLGINVEVLQRYRYAARQAGLSNEELDGTLSSLQSTLTKVTTGEINGLPWAGQIEKLTGIDINSEMIQRLASRPQEFLRILQEYAQKEDNVPLANQVLSSFGIPPGVIQALRRGTFNDKTLAQAPVASEGEIDARANMDTRWGNLGEKIQRSVDKFNVMFGPDIITNLEKLIPQVLKLAEAFATLAKNGKFFEVVGMAFQGWTEIFKTLNALVVEFNEVTAKSGSTLASPGNVNFKTETPTMQALGELLDAITGKSKNPSGVTPPVNSPSLPRIEPPMLLTPTIQGNQRLEFNQTLNFNGNVNDTGGVSRATKGAIDSRQINNAVQSLQSSNRGS